MGLPVPFNEDHLQRGQDRTLARLAAGEPEAYLLWEATVQPQPDIRAAARASLGLQDGSCWLSRCTLPREL